MLATEQIYIIIACWLLEARKACFGLQDKERLEDPKQ
jgi:hypothetical protein